MRLESSARVALLAAACLALGWLLTRLTDFGTTDFFCYWSGARFVTRGLDPYQEDLWRAATTGARPMAPFCTGAYPGPLWTAVLMAPLGLLPFPLAASLWMALALGASLAGLRLVSRATPVRRDELLFYVLVLFSQPFWVLLVGGQFSGVLLLATGVLLRSVGEPRGWSGGVALSFVAIKPQLVAVLGPLELVLAAALRRRTLVVAALVTGALLAGVSLAIRPAWPLEWLASATAPRLAILPYLATAWGLAADVAGDWRWGTALVGALAAALAWLLRGRRVSAVEWTALAIAFSLFASPHTWSYDFLLLAPAWWLTLAAPRAATRLALVACASPLPWVLYAVGLARGQETWSAVVPAASALLLAMAIRSRP